jgi:putative colanic acid biosynthesis UDP-glucose lipid carrier transferase
MPIGQVRPADASALRGVWSYARHIVLPVVAVLSLWCTSLAYDGAISQPYAELSIFTFLLALFLFGRTRASSSMPLAETWDEATTIVLRWCVLCALLLVFGYVTKSSADYSRKVIVTWTAITPCLFIAICNVIRWRQRAQRASGRNVRNAVIVGSNKTGSELFDSIASDPSLGMSVQGYFDDRSSTRLGELFVGARLGSLDNVVEYVNSHQIGFVYVTLPMIPNRRILDLLDALGDTTASIYFVPDIHIYDLIQARIDQIQGIPVVAINETPFFGVHRLSKRLLDIIVSVVVLVLSLPLMILIALGVKLSSPGPVVFGQWRYGIDGERFLIYKFRTMYTCDDGDQQATSGDPRLTRFGAFLRRYSLDELPQFVNVLKGQMSVVGPRPHAVAHNESYRKLIKGYMIRHKVKPGITGWAQVNGFRGETRTLQKMQDRISHDHEYVRHWSLGLDILIIFKTFAHMHNDGVHDCRTD